MKWIDTYVDGLTEHCYSKDIFDIYNVLDININRLDANSFILQGNESMYIRDYFGIEVVFIEDNLPYQFEKFILAHELGHAVLHTELEEAAYNSGLLNRGKLEKQANYFALKLLNIKADNLYQEGFSYEQISNDLFITESSIELLI